MSQFRWELKAITITLLAINRVGKLCHDCYQILSSTCYPVNKCYHLTLFSLITA